MYPSKSSTPPGLLRGIRSESKMNQARQKLHFLSFFFNDLCWPILSLEEQNNYGTRGSIHHKCTMKASYIHRL
jgi:hypothetical protein